MHPADGDQSLELDASGVRGEQERRAALLLAHEGRIARVHARRERLAQQGVAVVPHADEPEPGRGGVDGRPVPDDHACLAPRGVEERAVAVAARLAGIGAKHPTRVDGCREGGLELLLVAVVGHDEERRAIGREGVRGGLRERDGPRANPLPRREAHRPRIGGE